MPRWQQPMMGEVAREEAGNRYRVVLLRILSSAHAKTFVGVLWPMFGPTAAPGLIELVAELKMMPDVESVPICISHCRRWSTKSTVRLPGRTQLLSGIAWEPIVQFLWPIQRNTWI